MRQIYNLMEHEDLEGMARLSLTLLEPLPPIDTDQVIKAVEQVFWDALIAKRPYRQAWSKDKALKFIKEQKGKKFDPKIVDQFLEYLQNSK